MNRSKDELFDEIANAKDVDQQQTKEEYFDLLERIQKLTDDSGESGVPIKNLRDVLQQANKTFEKVLRPNEAKLDAEVLKHVGALGKTMIEKTQSSFMSFKPIDFADKIMSFIGIEGPDCLCSQEWLRVGTHTESFYKPSQGLTPLYGALEWKRPERSAPRERQVNTEEETVVLRTVADPDGSSREHDQEDVNRVYNALKVAYKNNGLQPILLLNFIINPDCFSTTIHNMFHLSFLIRDGYVQVYKGEGNVIDIVPIRKNMINTQQENQKTSQAIVDLDYETFVEIKKILKIRRPMIPVSLTSSLKRNRP